MDGAHLGALDRPTRIAVGVVTLLVSAGFFIVTHLPKLRGVLYTEAASLQYLVLVRNIGCVIYLPAQRLRIDT